MPSLSCKTLIYKGMLNAPQVDAILPRPARPGPGIGAGAGPLALQHQHVPDAGRAHPYRYIAHNGEINTLRGNINWMHARESMLASELFGDDINKILPIIDETGSDSAMFDNVLEMLVLTGRSLPHAIMMMIPEPWAGDPTMSAGEAGVLRISLVPDGAVGRPGVDRLHRRHAASAPCSTATACARRAITSPRTTWSSWRRRSACSTFRRRRIEVARAGCNRAACSSIDLDAGPHHRRRRAKGKALPRKSRTPNGSRRTSSSSRTCPRCRRRTSRTTRPSCNASRRSATRSRICAS